MKLGQHAAVSAAIGVGLWVSTGDVLTLPAALAAGVLPDVDHLVDYYNWYIRRDTRRIILILHGWEYLAAAILVYAFVFTTPWMLAVVLGYASQIGGDQIFNGVRWRTYSLLGRASARFEVARLLTVGVAKSYETLAESLPFLREPIRRWFERRLAQPAGNATSSGRAARQTASPGASEPTAR